MSEIPLVLMGYLNNVLAYGEEALVQSCAAKGVDGLIVADVWAGSGWQPSDRIVTVDQLGDEFLEFVRDGDRIVIREDGTVTIQQVDGT